MKLIKFQDLPEPIAEQQALVKTMARLWSKRLDNTTDWYYRLANNCTNADMELAFEQAIKFEALDQCFEKFQPIYPRLDRSGYPIEYMVGPKAQLAAKIRNILAQ